MRWPRWRSNQVERWAEPTDAVEAAQWRALVAAMTREQRAAYRRQLEAAQRAEVVSAWRALGTVRRVDEPVGVDPTRALIVPLVD